MAKKRLDTLLVDKGLFETREKAKKSIMAGVVKVDGNIEDKPGLKVDENAAIEIKKEIHPFVSRGGLKLQKAIEEFSISLKGKNCMDIGASTGGFTDCMLKSGAALVYAIDVGYGQLDWKLRNDPRVVVMERTNIRYVTKEQIKSNVEFASIDVSFISLKIVLPVVIDLLTEDGEIVCLIKPQFEAGREKVGKKGVVTESKTHLEVVKGIIDFSHSIGLHLKNLSYSPIKGPEGNIEYLAYFSKKETDMGDVLKITEKVVDDSHKFL